MLQQLQRSRMIKAYQEEMELLVGSSREFQGDERDIIILSVCYGRPPSGKMRMNTLP